MKRVTNLIPNGLTMLNLIFGFLSIINAVSGNFINASIFIFLATLADSTDGKVARKFKATSDIGIEFDSLSDLTSFGVAAAILLYLYSLSNLSYGIYISILIVVCAALRLARFNVERDETFFTGLPSPAVGFFAAAYVFSGVRVDPSILALLFAFVALLMVSNIRYPTFKRATKKVWGGLITLITAILIISYYYREFVLFPFILYAVIGPFVLKWSKK